MTAKSKVGGNGHKNDGCEGLARASGGQLNTVQVRMLRALKAFKKPATRAQIKEATGHWPHRPGQYHIKWTRSLRALHEGRARDTQLVTVEEHEPDKGPAKLVYAITQAGRDKLAALDKAAKEAVRKSNGEANGKK